MYQVLLFKFRRHLCKGSIIVSRSLYRSLLHLSVTTCAMIGQFSGPYFPFVTVVKLFRNLSPSVLTFIASKSLKLSFTQNCVLKRASDLKTISNWLVLLSRCVRNSKAREF